MSKDPELALAWKSAAEAAAKACKAWEDGESPSFKDLARADAWEAWQKAESMEIAKSSKEELDDSGIILQEGQAESSYYEDVTVLKSLEWGRARCYDCGKKLTAEEQTYYTEECPCKLCYQCSKQ